MAFEAIRPVVAWPRHLIVEVARARYGEIEVRIQDTGIGFDAAMADEPFAPFNTTRLGGTGLGLDLSRTIFEAHGGLIGIAPAPVKGAIFHFAPPGTGSRIPT